jgi:integrase
VWWARLDRRRRSARPPPAKAPRPRRYPQPSEPGRSSYSLRTVPIHPELAKLLREHIEQFGYSPDGKLFTGVKGGELPTITIRRAWIAARASVLTEKEHASPLAKRIYDLRHACLSLWLNAGVPPTQVAAWAGHSVDVLLRILPNPVQDRTHSKHLLSIL